MLTLESDVAITLKKILIKLYDVILKNKEVLICILMVLIIPSAFSFILGYEFSANQIMHVPAIIVDHDNSTLSKNLIDQIKTNQIFNVTHYSEKDDEVDSLIEKGDVAVGIIVPDNFSIDLLDGKSPKVMVIYDGTQMTLVSAAKGKISEVLGTIEASFLIQLQEGKLGVMPKDAMSNIMPIQYTTRFLGNPAKSTAYFMIQGCLLNITQIGIFLLGIVMASKKSYFRSLVRGLACGLIGSISILSVLKIQYQYYAFPYRGSVAAASVLTILFSTGIGSLGILLGLIKKDKAAAMTSFMAPITVTFLLSGYTFPVTSMPDIFTSVSKIIPITYYAIPMRDLSLLGLHFNDMLPNVYWLVKFLAIMWLCILLIFIIRKAVKGDFKKRGKDEISKVHS